MRSRKKLKNLTKIKLKNSTRVSLVCLSLVIFAFSSAAFYNSLFNNNVTKVEQDFYTYTNDYNIDYSVNMKTNPFITESSLPSGQTYISDLIDDLNVNISYNYSGSKQALIDYDYKIDAVVGANYNNDGDDYSVWNKEYNLKTSEKLQANNKLTIKENFNVNFAQFHQEVKNFKQTLGMTVDAFLYIRLTVNTKALVDEQIVPNQYISNFSITLGDKVAIVDNKAPDTKIDSLKITDTINETNVSIPKLIISLAVVLASVYTLYFVSFKTKKYNTVKNEYKLELNRILKSCQDRIVIVKNRPEADSDNIIDVNDFGELIKLSEELFKPILCHLSDEQEDEQAVFCVISNKLSYRYILKKD